MILQDRSYNTNFFRPRPKVESSQEYTICLTSWAFEDRSADLIKTIFESLRTDQVSDETVLTVREEKTELEKLIDSIKSANSKVFQNYNNNEYRYCFEVMILKHVQNKVMWANVGSPFLFMHTGTEFIPLSYGPDWGWRNGQVTPLPRATIGLSKVVDVQSGQFELTPQDGFCMLNRSYAPASFYQCEFDLSRISDLLIHENENLPFWIGLFR